MQESLFNVYSTQHSVSQSKHNMRQTAAVSTGESFTVPTNLKVKTSSLSGSTPLKRALQDVGNRLQPPHSMPGKVSGNPQFLSRQQNTPSILKSNKKTPLHKLISCKENNPVEQFTPELQKLSGNSDPPGNLEEAYIDFNAEPEIFPNWEDETEGSIEEDIVFPKNERLTWDDIFRVDFSSGATKPRDFELDLPVMEIIPPVFPVPKEPLFLEIPFDLLEPQVPIPDLPCIDCDYESVL